MEESNNDNDNSGDVEVNHEKFQKTQNQLEEIRESIRKEQPLASDLLSLEVLRKNYEPGSNFDKGVTVLASDYSGVRSVRGDGNCYYRAFLYSLCEKLFDAKQEEKVRLKKFGKYWV